MSAPRRSFFDWLRERWRVEPSAGFERRFWARFEAEFDRPAASEPRWRRAVRALEARIAARPVRFATVFSLVALSGAFLYRSYHPDPRTIDEMALVIDVLDEAQGEAVRELELFSEFESLPTDEEEWDVLLADGGSS